MEILLEKIALALAILIFGIRYICEKDKLPFALYFYIILIPYNMTLATTYPLLDTCVEILLILTGISCIFKHHFLLKVNKYMMFYYTSVLISALILTLYALDFRVIINNSELRFMTGIFLLSIIMLNLIQNKQQCFQILDIFSTNATIIAIGGIVTCWLKGYHLGEYRLGFILGINHYAIFLFIGLLATIYIAISNHENYNLHSYIKIVFSIFIIGIACLCTKSAAIYMALGLVIILLFIYLLKIQIYKLWKWCFGILFVFSFCAMGTVALGNYGEIFQRLLGLLGRGIELSRLQIWEMAFNDFISHPIFGIGPGAFRANINGFNYISHNDFFKILAETGIIGICTFCMYLFDILKSCFLLKKKHDILFTLSLCGSMLVFMLTHNYTIYAVFWVLTCMIKKMHLLNGEFNRDFK